MAPDSRFWRHQLGEATSNLQRNWLKPTLVLCLLPTFFVTNVEARTEFDADPGKAISSPFAAYEKLTSDGVAIPSFLPPSTSYHASSPAGRWNNRIQIHIPLQPAVEKYVRYYNGKGKSTILEAMERSWSYVPVMAEILQSHGVPPEFVAIVMVESCFKRKASFKGARGYWQLLASTARSMGLRVDRWVDERMDPIKSTQAAARYLRSFYDEYHCWSLALAAYNAGGGPVERAVKRHGSCDFWELSKHRSMPGRTLAYVPKVLAAVQVVRDLESGGFKRPLHFAVYDFEPIWIRSPLRLEQVAQWLNVPISDLQDLNSSLCQDQVPPDPGFMLRLPSGFRDRFDTAYEDYLRKH